MDNVEITNNVEQLRRGSRWVALVVLCVGQLMIILDGTIVNVALPVIRRDLGFAQSNLAWVVNVYMIAFGSLLLLAGRLGDLIGRKRMFVIGLAVFILASLSCGLSNSQTMLVVSRFVQGVGAAIYSAVILGIIVALFTDGRERTKAIGVFAFVGASGASIGLLAGGVITQGLSWHWIFLVNVPIGAITAALGMYMLHEDRGLGVSKGADLIGAFLVTAGLMLLVYTVSETASVGWGSARTLGLLALTIVLLALFVLRQAKAKTPVLPLRIFRSRQLSGANLVQIPMVTGMFGFQLVGALYLERVLAYTPLQTGLAYLPTPIVIAVLSLGFSRPLIMRFGGRAVLLAGLILTAAALAWLIRLPVDGHYLTDVLPAMLLLARAQAWLSRRSRAWRCLTPRLRTLDLPQAWSIPRSKWGARLASPSWYRSPRNARAA